MSFVIVATAFIGLAWPIGGFAQTAPSGCNIESDFEAREIVPAMRIELLVATGNTVPRYPRDMRDEYVAMATAVLRCASDGAQVEVRPITDEGIDAPPVFSGAVPTMPPDNHNTMRQQIAREIFVKSASRAIRTVVYSALRYEGFDPLGSMYAAGDAARRGSPSTKRIIVIIGNGWQQTTRVNLFRYNDNPAKHAGDVIRQLRNDDVMPNLAGMDVVLAGVTRGDPHLKVGDREIVGLRHFWEHVVRAAGGDVVYCDRVLPGFTAPL